MARTGRPRAQGPSRSGLTTQQDILRAAARLFCNHGYGSTSTHKIAAEAGLSQASMYHYFAGKHALLLALLLETVQPSLDHAEGLARRHAPADVRLWSLCAVDVQVLLSGEDNLGALYLLPELGDERFASFHDLRTGLFRGYRDLVAEVLDRGPEAAHPQASIVFGLVESVILRRRTEPHLVATDVAPMVADAALRVLGVDDERLRAVRELAAALD